jgi:hypothetical protein
MVLQVFLYKFLFRNNLFHDTYEFFFTHTHFIFTELGLVVILGQGYLRIKPGWVNFHQVHNKSLLSGYNSYAQKNRFRLRLFFTSIW